jgi:hypothetical protein
MEIATPLKSPQRDNSCYRLLIILFLVELIYTPNPDSYRDLEGTILDIDN